MAREAPHITIKEVRDRLSTLRTGAQLRLDPEALHSIEDRLHLDVLLAIGAGTCDDPTTCAKLAASSSTINFPRWSG